MAQLPISRTKLETLILSVTAFVLSGSLIRILSSGDSDLISSGDRRYEMVLALVFLATFLLDLSHFGQGIRALFRTPALLFLVFLACASFLWADLPGLVLRRTVGVLGTTYFGLILATRLDFEQQLILLRRIARIAAAMTIAAWVLGHFMGADLVTGATTVISGHPIEIDAGAWRGIFNHKNGLGAMMALAILVEWHIPAQTWFSKTWKAIWMCAYAALLLLSNSITSIVAAGLTILLMVTVKTFRQQYRLLVPLLLLVTMFSGALIALNAGSVTGALGRSANLSGRGALWHWVAVMILKKPYLGYGFSGFWKGASERSQIVETLIGWSPIYAHNGYLEIMLSLGFAGLLLFLWMAATGMRRVMIHASTPQSIQDLWPLAFLAFFLIHNLGECTILWQNNLEWAIFVATVVGADPRLRACAEAVPPKDEIAVDPALEYS
jgi:exopolysaccharide production protein ExoQ